MKSIVLSVVVAGLSGWWGLVSAATISGTASNLNQLIPDASSGTVLPSTISLSSGGQLISSLCVSVLGSSSLGLNVTFFHASPVDLKTSIPMILDASYSEGGENDGLAQVTGVFQPDGRAVSPFSADLHSPTTETRTLSAFNNMAVDGPWTLSLARIDSLETSTLESWSVEVTTTTVPVPGTVLPSMLLVWVGVYVRFIRRHRPGRRETRSTANPAEA